MWLITTHHISLALIVLGLLKKWKKNKTSPPKLTPVTLPSLYWIDFYNITGIHIRICLNDVRRLTSLELYGQIIGWTRRVGCPFSTYGGSEKSLLLKTAGVNSKQADLTYLLRVIKLTSYIVFKRLLTFYLLEFANGH